MVNNQDISYVAWKRLINCKNICIVVCFLLGYSSASELYMLTFQNNLSVPSSKAGTYRPMKMEQTESSEMSVYKIQTPGNYPEENIQHSEHGESLKSRKYLCFLLLTDKSCLPIFPLVNLVSVFQERRLCSTTHVNIVVPAVTRCSTDSFNFKILERIFSLCWRFELPLCFVDRASRYNRVKKSELDAQFFLVYFVNLYMFRAYLGPSSGGTAVCIQQLVLIILFRWLSVVLVGLDNSIYTTIGTYNYF